MGEGQCKGQTGHPVCAPIENIGFIVNDPIQEHGCLVWDLGEGDVEHVIWATSVVSFGQGQFALATWKKGHFASTVFGGKVQNVLNVVLARSEVKTKSR